MNARHSGACVRDYESAEGGGGAVDLDEHLHVRAQVEIEISLILKRFIILWQTLQVEIEIMFLIRGSSYLWQTLQVVYRISALERCKQAKHGQRGVKMHRPTFMVTKRVGGGGGGLGGGNGVGGGGGDGDRTVSSRKSLAGIACHVIGCHLIQESRVEHALDVKDWQNCSPRHRVPFNSRLEGSNCVA